MPVTITDPADQRLRDFVSLTDVRLRRLLEPEGGLYLAESAKVIRRALDAGHRPRALLLAPRWVEELPDIVERVEGAGAPVYVASAEIIESVTGFNLHRGAIASMHRPELPALADVLASHHRSRGSQARHRSRIAVLDGLVDHTNVGACFRSAAAMGVDGVLVTASCADPLYRRSIRVSMGTVFQVPWTRLSAWPQDAERLTEAGYVVAGMTLGEGSITLDDLVAEDHPRLALVFGTEGHGLAPPTEEVLDRKVTIPMLGGVDSLNVAAASAVAFYATR